MITPRYNYTTLTRENIDGKRHYCLPDGSKVGSVTTILDKTKPQKSIDALNNWRKRMGDEKATQITKEASGVGTRMHTYLESYILTDTLKEPGTNPFSIQSHGMAKKIIESAFSNLTEVWGMEASLYFSGLYAGSTDCVGLWKGKPAIIDFKQTNKPKKREWIEDYFLQLSAYSLAHNHMFGTEINTGVILMCSRNNEYQEFVVEGDEFLAVKEQWWDRVTAYYQATA